MSVANNEVQVLWATASSKSVAAGATETSDAMTLTAGAVAGVITAKGDNAGTPASGDTVDVYYAPTSGDPDGASDSEYPTAKEDAIFLTRLNTYGSGRDPAIASVCLPCVGLACKIIAKSNAASNDITVSACINEKVVS